MKLLFRSVLVIVGVVLLAEVACVARQIRDTPNPPTTHIKLRSGRDVELIKTGVFEGPPRVWFFQYRTRTPIRDRQALRREVEALWPDIQEQADSSGVRLAHVWPVSFSREFAFRGLAPCVATHFGTILDFEKNAEGTWSMQ